MMGLRRAASAMLAVCVLALFLCSTGFAAGGTVPRAKVLRPLTLGFSGGADVVLASGSASTQARWVPRADREGTQIVRLDVILERRGARDAP